jgi:serine/threonine-protein kinase
VHTAFPASFLGTQLDGRYRLDRLMGEGASAWVFAAHDLRLEREVAVKLLKPRPVAEDAQRRRRFVIEGRTLAKLVHPHVVLVHDAGETPQGLAYLVMELSEAGSLEAELFRRGALPANETLQLLLPLVGALACAHDRGIVHRDLKPANIVLVREAMVTRAKLLDFGIAKPSDAGTDSASGTPSYMAPEQARGERATPAVDVWALGVVFFQCLSGRLPFDAANSLEGLMKLVHERAPLFADVCPGLGPQLARALDRALERDAERRYPNMRSFAYALAAACVQDGIALPLRPEPLGLPEFESWLAKVDVEGTRPLAANERAAIAVAPVRSFVPRTPRSRAALFVWAIAGLALGLGLILRRSERVVRAERAQAPRTVVVEAASVPAAPLSDALQVHVNAVPSIAAQAESTHVREVQPIRTPVSRPRSARRRSSESNAPAQPSAPEQAPQVHEPKKSGVIKNWDW